MPAQIDIQGCGVAASCCALLLQRKGFDVSFARVNQRSGPTLLLNPGTQMLLAEVFEDGDLLKGLPTIQRRVIRWAGEAAIAIPHSGVVITEQVLLRRLWSRIEECSADLSRSADFTIHSTLPTSNGTRLRFGSREAAAIPVQTRETAAEACWIEALDTGWLFLLSSGKSVGTLLAVGGSPCELLDQSRLVRQQVVSFEGAAAAFAASPQILNPLCGPDWLACGNAAMSFDPVCGEGVGNAVREAILASAVIESMIVKSNASGVLDHYVSRLLAGFYRHLTISRDFYRAACVGEWWKVELAALEEGIVWTEKHLSSAPTPRYKLAGFDLEPLRDEDVNDSPRVREQHIPSPRRS